METPLILAALCVLITETAGAAAPEEHGFWTRDTLTGDSGGLRTRLDERGVKLDLSLTGYYAGALEGGVDRRFDFGGRADAFVDFDTGKLGLWKGGGFHFHLESRFGEASERVGARSGGLWPVNVGVILPLGQNERVVASSIYYSQRLGESAKLMLGKINAVDLLAGDAFFGGWARDRFMNPAFVAPPSGVLPPTIIGGIVSCQSKPLSFTFMAFDPQDRTNDYWPEDLFESGVNFSLGATWSGTLAGRATSVGVTGTYSTKEGANLGELLLPENLQTGPKEGSYNVALSVSHLLYELPDKPGKGFGIYGKGAIADGNPNPIQSSFVGGFAGHGVVPDRPHDSFGIGYYFYNLSDDLQDATGATVPINDEQGVELYYNFAVTPWFRVTADLQWIDPALAANRQAWVASFRANIRF